jgi:hypothetical protein
VGGRSLSFVRVGGFSRMKNPLVRRYGSGDRFKKSSAPFAKSAKRCPSTGSGPTSPMIGSARREAWWCVRCSSRLPPESQKRNRLERLSHPPKRIKIRVVAGTRITRLHQHPRTPQVIFHVVVHVAVGVSSGNPRAPKEYVLAERAVRRAPRRVRLLQHRAPRPRAARTS